MYQVTEFDNFVPLQFHPIPYEWNALETQY
jgi:hypothetical protein